MTQTEQFATITSKCGVHVDTTAHRTQRAAEMAARRSIKAGTADSAAVYDNHTAVKFFGSGR